MSKNTSHGQGQSGFKEWTPKDCSEGGSELKLTKITFTPVCVMISFFGLEIVFFKITNADLRLIY